MSGDPRAAVAPELLAGLDLMPDLALSEANIALLRQPRSPPPDAPPLPPALAAVACEERWIKGSDGAPDVRLLLYRPPGAATGPRPAYLQMHGGGYVLGTPEISDAANRAFVAALDCIVASVDYRLAPEASFPAARGDCYAALGWLHREAATLGIDPARIAIGGESAGGGHAAALAIHARDRGEYPICLMLLDAPMLDDRTGSSADPHPHGGQLVWTAEKNRFGWGALLGRAPGGDDISADAVPARCGDLTGLPPTFISVGALDLFLEEDLEFARRLARAGVPVALHVIPGAYHGFGIAGPAAPQVADLQAWRMAALGRAFAGKA